MTGIGTGLRVQVHLLSFGPYTLCTPRPPCTRHTPGRRRDGVGHGAGESLSRKTENLCSDTSVLRPCIPHYLWAREERVDRTDRPNNHSPAEGR